MKKVILSAALICAATWSLYAQVKRPPVIVRPVNTCCSNNPYVLTPCATALFQSFKNLTAGVGVHICNTSLNYPGVSFAMPHNCYSLMDTAAGIVTFTSFYVPAVSEFRVIWGSVPGNFSYYGVCAPDPIIFPHPGIIENHVFAARLIRQNDYKAFSGAVKDYPSMAAVPYVKVVTIEKILAVYMEEKGGFISTTEAASYNSRNSSKGIVVKVKLKRGGTELCYLVNNYDDAGTIYWKEPNPACIP